MKYLLLVIYLSSGPIGVSELPENDCKEIAYFMQLDGINAKCEEY